MSIRFPNEKRWWVFVNAHYTTHATYVKTIGSLPVRCPGHTIQFSGYGYAEYIKEVLGVVGINANTLEWKRYESKTHFTATSGVDRSRSSHKSLSGV
jgi:hypothetical protein